MFFSLKAFVLFFFNNGGICVFCNLCFIAGNWNSVQVKSLTTHAPKQYCFYLWNINCYLIELPFYIFNNVLDKFISQTFTFFLSQTRSKSYKKVHNDISSNTRNKKGFLPFNINLSKYYFVSLVSVLGQKNHKNLLKKEFNSLLLNFVITKLK